MTSARKVVISESGAGCATRLAAAGSTAQTVEALESVDASMADCHLVQRDAVSLQQLTADYFLIRKQAVNLRDERVVMPRIVVYFLHLILHGPLTGDTLPVNCVVEMLHIHIQHACTPNDYIK